MNDDARYAADPDRIVAEELPGEVMVVDLDTGYYYVLDGVAADLWPLVAKGATIAEASAALATRYDAPVDEIGAAVTDFVGQLASEGLLRPVSTVPPTDDSLADSLAPSSGDVEPASGRVPFTLPSMTRYTDMANLVQMDPIRDFEERRWPTKWRFGRQSRLGGDDAT